MAEGGALGIWGVIYEDIKVNIMESSLGESVLLSSVFEMINNSRLRTQEQSH